MCQTNSVNGYTRHTHTQPILRKHRNAINASVHYVFRVVVVGSYSFRKVLADNGTLKVNNCHYGRLKLNCL
jgi:hypothetical protein